MHVGEFLLKTLQIGCIGFGGGNALIPVIEQTLLDDDDPEKREQLDRDVVVANLTPGALPVEILSSVGRRVYGARGMVAGATAFAIPGSVIAILIMILFTGSEEGALSLIKIASVGISAFIICLLVSYVTKVVVAAKPQLKVRTVFVIFMVCVFVCGKNIVKITGVEYTPLFGVSTLAVLGAAFFWVFFVQTFKNRGRAVAASALCLVFFLGHGKAGVLSGTIVLDICEAAMVLLSVFGIVDCVRRQPAWRPVRVAAIFKDLGCWSAYMAVLILPAVVVFPAQAMTVAAFIGRGALSSLMSFGGGDAYLAVAEGLFVDTGLISPDRFFTEVVTVVNATPGSILCKTLSSVGYVLGMDSTGSYAGGVLFALAGFGCSVAMSCIAFGLVNHLYDSLIELQVFMALGRWIRPIVAGLLVNVALSLVNQCTGISAYADVSASAVLAFLFVLIVVNIAARKKVPATVLLVVDIAAAFAWVNILQVCAA